MKTMKYWAVILITLMLVACGGGGGSADPDGGETDDGSVDPDTTPIDLALQAGDYWEFFYTSEQINFAQPNTTSASINVGRFKITLGASVMINDQTAYPLTVTGDTNGSEFLTRWTHLAVDADGSLLGSSNGLNLETIYDADTHNWVGGGMFVDFTGNAIEVSSGLFPGVYNQLNAIVAGREFDNDRCETILGNTICGDSSTEFSEREYYKEGVGPIGYAQTIFHSDDGGGFFTSTRINKTIELIDSSFAATDGSVFKLPPWEEMASLNVARSQHSAVALNGLIYVLGGINQSSELLNSVEIYNPTNNQWTMGPAMPTATTASASVANGRIYIPLNTTSVMEFNPTMGWTTRIPANNPGIDLSDTASYTDTHFGFGEILVGANSKPAGAGAINFGAYDPDTNQWLFSSGTPQGYAELLRFTVETVGDSMFLIGGFGESGLLLDERGARNTIMEFDIVADQWVSTQSGQLNLPRDDHASVVFNDKIYVFGGAPVSCNLAGCARGNPYREAEVYNPATKQSTDLALMFQPREAFAAVELDGKIYVIGGENGSEKTAAVERLTAN